MPSCQVSKAFSVGIGMQIMVFGILNYALVLMNGNFTILSGLYSPNLKIFFPQAMSTQTNLQTNIWEIRKLGGYILPPGILTLQFTNCVKFNFRKSNLASRTILWILTLFPH